CFDIFRIRHSEQRVGRLQPATGIPPVHIKERPHVKNLVTTFVLALMPTFCMAAGRDLPAQIIKGTVKVITVGGVETPARKAVAIGENRYEVVGARDAIQSLFGADGHYVEV